MKNYDLIIKYLNGEASEEELQELYKWVQESPENKKLFGEIKNTKAISSSQFSSDIQGDFNSLLHKIRKSENKDFSLKNFYKIAATVFFPILFAVCGGLIYVNYFQNPEPVFTEVIAPSKNSSQVILSDGTHVWLSPESKLLYSQKFGKDTRKVKLIGEGYFEVEHDESLPFIVETYALNVRVLGTSFNVEAYPEDNIIRTTLVRGSVKVDSEKFSDKIVLKPGEMLTVDKSNNQYSTEVVNTEIYRLVKEGLLIFKRNNLSEVCSKLERWFMVPIEYDGKGNQSLLFTAKFEDESIEQILKIVSQTIPINYQIKKDKIIVTYKE